MTTLTINEGLNPHTGITERVHFEDGNIVLQKTFDAEPHLNHAQQIRESNEGKNWGEGRIVGHIPPAFYGQLLLIKDPQEKQKALRRFFQENPAFCTYQPYLKR